MKLTSSEYSKLKNPILAFMRDLMSLRVLGAVEPIKEEGTVVRIRLEWPREISESEFFERLESLPKAKTHRFSR
jgi:hypothetical protein